MQREVVHICVVYIKVITKYVEQVGCANRCCTYRDCIQRVLHIEVIHIYNVHTEDVLKYVEHT